MAEPDRLIETYLTLRAQIVRLVMRIVPPKEVEDIVQETYVRVCQIKNKASVREPRSFLFRTAQNLALDHLKRAESRLTVSSDDPMNIDDLSFLDVDTTFRQVTSDEEFVLFCEAVRELPEQCRRAFVLKKVYGYTLKEIMAEMGIGQPTVETHIVNGTKKCVQYLRDRKNQTSAKQPHSRNSNAHSSLVGRGGKR